MGYASHEAVCAKTPFKYLTRALAPVDFSICKLCSLLEANLEDPPEFFSLPVIDTDEFYYLS